MLVSFNSDDDGLARRLNTEAAKAVKYGGAPPAEALNFVTINPAKQLRIDDRVGSLEPGKDADFVIWSASPLSAYARVEQTWIEGRRYFSIEEDAQLRTRDAGLRRALVQKALLARQKSLLKAGKGGGENEKEKEKENDPPMLEDHGLYDDGGDGENCSTHGGMHP
ncbi:MAG: amidohydrolase family protein [Opitutaceae bacterium]